MSVNRLLHEERGAAMVVFGVMLPLILLIVAMLFLAGKIDDLFSSTGTSVANPGPLP